MFFCCEIAHKSRTSRREQSRTTLFPLTLLVLSSLLMRHLHFRLGPSRHRTSVPLGCCYHPHLIRLAHLEVPLSLPRPFAFCRRNPSPQYPTSHLNSHWLLHHYFLCNLSLQVSRYYQSLPVNYIINIMSSIVIILYMPSWCGQNFHRSKLYIWASVEVQAGMEIGAKTSVAVVKIYSFIFLFPFCLHFSFHLSPITTTPLIHFN